MTPHQRPFHGADDLTVVTIGHDLDHGVVAVPDRHDDGTNVLLVPTGAGFEVAYGPGSFARHRQEADRLGLTFTVVRARQLMRDVDDPTDLEPGDLEPVDLLPALDPAPVDG